MRARLQFCTDTGAARTHENCTGQAICEHREGLSGPVTARKKGQTAVAGVREIRASLKRLGLHACGAYELHKLAACRLVCYRSLANRRGNLAGRQGRHTGGQDNTRGPLTIALLSVVRARTGFALRQTGIVRLFFTARQFHTAARRQRNTRRKCPSSTAPSAFSGTSSSP